jgi:CheY-like chemotaxis protein
MNNAPGALAGRRVLIAEDEFLIVDDLAHALEGCGAEVVGPVATVGEALELVASEPCLDGAVLDINLVGEMAFPVADALRARGVPFVFATGYDAHVVPPRFDGVKRCEKPMEPRRVVETLSSSMAAFG